MGKLRVISHDDRPFRNREEAGRLLAAELSDLRGQNALILGIPRGGVVLAQELARELQGEVDIALARKPRAPQNPELAIGALAEHGEVYVDQSLVRYVGMSTAALEQEKQRVAGEISQRQRLYRQAREKVSLQGRLVVITDDGLATGSTMRAALMAARTESPARLICAVPVGADSAVTDLSALCDELVCLRVPMFFGAVGQFYLQFDQIEDSEVVEILRQEAQRAPAR